MQYEKLFRTQSVWKSIFFTGRSFSNYYFGYDSLQYDRYVFYGSVRRYKTGSGCFRGGSAFFFVSSSGDYVR